MVRVQLFGLCSSLPGPGATGTERRTTSKSRTLRRPVRDLGAGHETGEPARVLGRTQPRFRVSFRARAAKPHGVYRPLPLHWYRSALCARSLLFVRIDGCQVAAGKKTAAKTSKLLANSRRTLHMVMNELYGHVLCRRGPVSVQWWANSNRDIRFESWFERLLRFDLCTEDSIWSIAIRLKWWNSFLDGESPRFFLGLLTYGQGVMFIRENYI